jgi:hypothetical protein
MVGLGSGAVLALAIILGVSGAFGGGDNGNGTATTATSNANAGQELTRVKLQPQSGQRGSGTVVFGLDSSGSQPYVDLTLDGLAPPPQNQAYVVWLLLTRDQGFPAALVRPCSSSAPEPCLSENGSYRDRATFAQAVLPLVARVRFVDVSIAPVAGITKAINTAVKNQNVIFRPPGTSVLRGEIPRARGGGNAG